MRRHLPALVATVLLVISVAGLWRALSESAHPGLGLLASALLVFAIVAFAVMHVRQRERLRDVRQALARSEVRAQALVEASPDGVALLSGRRIVFANPAFRHLLALPPDEDLAGRDVLSLVAAADRERVGVWIEARESGARGQDKTELTGLRLSGAEISLEAASALVPAQTGRQLALFLRDLSGRQSLEARLKHLTRLEALADLGENLVRDFDRLFLEIRRIARGRGNEDEARSSDELLEAIERLASRGAAMTRRVRSLAPSAVDRSTHRPLDLVRLVREAAADFLRSSGPGLSLNVSTQSESNLVVSGDPAPIRQALWQVLQNAQEARPDGEIQLVTRTLQLDATRSSSIPGSRPGDYAVIEVSDAGPGMSEEVRARAFEPFYSTKGSRSSGLGLTLAYGTVRAHGGYSELDRRASGGTLVRLAFPLLGTQDIPREPHEPALDPRARWRGRETVLVVDDDQAGREEAMRLLESYGYHIELAGTPREALQRLRHRPEVDLVLLDMVLPGWNGPDVLRRILRHWPGQRVVMISPYPLQDHEEQALQLGAVGVYHKPIRDPQFPRTVREALDCPPPAAA
ncbi:MAG: response regulator [Acidobacteriota bacterium]|nr:MAG: response regulator [Acidobacteriota bacterium]